MERVVSEQGAEISRLQRIIDKKDKEIHSLKLRLSKYEKPFRLWLLFSAMFNASLLNESVKSSKRYLPYPSAKVQFGTFLQRLAVKLNPFVQKFVGV